MEVGVVAQVCHPSPWAADAGGLLQVPGWSRLHRGSVSAKHSVKQSEAEGLVGFLLGVQEEAGTGRGKESKVPHPQRLQWSLSQTAQPKIPKLVYARITVRDPKHGSVAKIAAAIQQ